MTVHTRETSNNKVLSVFGTVRYQDVTAENLLTEGESVSCLEDLVAHTRHSSQLFPVATGKNAHFLATVREAFNHDDSYLSLSDLDLPGMQHSLQFSHRAL
jgi:hypothetical protein